MSNLLDYIHWRGDIPFSCFPVGEVDGLILSQLSMFRWEEGWTGPCFIHDLSAVLEAEPVSVGFTTDNDKKMLDMILRSERFGNIQITDYVCEVNAENGKQFAAITLHLAKGLIFVSYRGTDKSITGWKEDCKMAFSKPVPAQEQAAEYLKMVAEKYSGMIQTGGHSKGGNLAMYAATNADEKVRERISDVYNYDGPGLSDKMDASALYKRISGRLHSYVPQGSLVGMLLAHPDQYTVVKSNSIGVLQHDPYTWQVDGPKFERMDSLAQESVMFDNSFRQWLSGISEEQREELVDTFFNILNATKAEAFDKEFWVRLAENSREVRTAIEGVSPETKNRITAMLSDFAKIQRQQRLGILDRAKLAVESIMKGAGEE